MNEKDNIERLPVPDNWRDVYPKRYIHTEDLTDKQGRYMEVNLRIARVEQHNIPNQKQGGKKQPNLVLYFDKAKKGLILNVTMCERLMKMTGSANPKEWVNETVCLFVEKSVHTPQGRQDVVRLKEPLAKQTAAPAQVPDFDGLPDEELDRIMSEEENEFDDAD